MPQIQDKVSSVIPFSRRRVKRIYRVWNWLFDEPFSQSQEQHHFLEFAFGPRHPDQMRQRFSGVKDGRERLCTDLARLDHAKAIYQ